MVRSPQPSVIQGSAASRRACPEGTPRLLTHCPPAGFSTESSRRPAASVELWGTIGVLRLRALAARSRFAQNDKAKSEERRAKSERRKAKAKSVKADLEKRFLYFIACSFWVAIWAMGLAGLSFCIC